MLNEHDHTLRKWARIINFQKPTGHWMFWRQSEWGKRFLGRRPSKFPEKKESHKLVWLSNNIRLGWEFLETIWVGKCFLGRRPSKLPLLFQTKKKKNLTCSFNFWQHRADNYRWIFGFFKRIVPISLKIQWEVLCFKPE